MSRIWTEPMHWDAEGTAPSAELQAEGFKAGYKPPASIFNYFLNKCGICIEELQMALDEVERGRIVEAVSEDGVAYTATVEGVVELYDGLEITIIPSINNASNAMTLNVNGLGAKPIKRPLSFSTYVNTNAEESFMRADTPCRLMYHADYPNRVDGVSGKGIWLMADKVKHSAQDLYGTTPIENGGTGADNAIDALDKLGAVNKSGDTMYGALNFERKYFVGDSEVIRGTRVKTNDNGFVFEVDSKVGMVQSYNLAPPINAQSENTFDIVTTGNFAEAKENLGFGIELLWSTLPEYKFSSFPAQTIELPIGGEYDAYIVTFGYSTTLGLETSSFVKFLGLNSTNGAGHFLKGDYAGTTAENEMWRPYYISRSAKIHSISFGAGYKDGSSNNNVCIPWTVWGIKF